MALFEVYEALCTAHRKHAAGGVRSNVLLSGNIYMRVTSLRQLKLHKQLPHKLSYSPRLLAKPRSLALAVEDFREEALSSSLVSALSINVCQDSSSKPEASRFFAARIPSLKRDQMSIPSFSHFMVSTSTASSLRASAPICPTMTSSPSSSCAKSL